MAARKNKNTALKLALAGNIRTYVQPIVNIKTNEITGWEALTRGPAGTTLERPSRLFSYAEKRNKIRNLEHLCIKNSLRLLQYVGDRKLFVNVGSALFSNQLDGIGDCIINDYSDSRLVLEITEQTRTDMNRLQEAAAWYRNKNISIAVDDVSSGHDRLKSILYLKPEYFKLERELVANCNEDRDRREIIHHLFLLGQSLGSQVIAEGVETREELNTLMEIGLELCQGFLFSKPFPAFKLMNGQFKDISCWR